MNSLLFEGGGLFSTEQGRLFGSLPVVFVFFFFLPNFVKGHAASRTVKRSLLVSWGSWLHVEQTSFGPPFPSRCWVADNPGCPNAAFNPLFIPRDCPAPHLSASLELSLLHLRAELSEHPPHSLFLLYKAEHGVWRPKTSLPEITSSSPRQADPCSASRSWDAV